MRATGSNIQAHCQQIYTFVGFDFGLVVGHKIQQTGSITKVVNGRSYRINIKNQSAKNINMTQN